MEMKNFEMYLKRKGLAESSVRSYSDSARFFSKNYTLSLESLYEYKGYLVEHYKPQTVNLRIQGINNYLVFKKKERWCLKAIKIQQKSYLENVISHEDYVYLKKKLLKEGNQKWYFIVWFLGATGARISELVKTKIEHIKTGYFDVYAKGGKVRRLFIPYTLQRECLEWLMTQERHSGYLFLNREGQQISSRGVSQQLKYYAKKYGIDPAVVYPHSFRHLFAKNFLNRHNDIALLADLMGHESIETTRIYLRKTSLEQQKMIDEIVTW